MKDLYAALKHLARRYNSRWSALDDALARIRAGDGEGRNTPGEPARRMLANAFRVQTYVDDTRERLRTDVLNAKRKLGKPLAEALGHIITIELGEQMLEEVDAAERRRWKEQSAAEQQERESAEYGPLIDALHKAGVARGNYTVLSPTEIGAIARYIRRKSISAWQNCRPFGQMPKHERKAVDFTHSGMPIACQAIRKIAELSCWQSA